MTASPASDDDKVVLNNPKPVPRPGTWISAAIAPQAGSVPSSEGPDTSGLVAMNFAPASIRRIACVSAWKS